jgi:H+-translocating NAD(P) transhydrogenase subunit alpha
MSAANSIHGIVLVGALLIGVTAHNAVGYVLAFIAAFFAAANVVGGYAVTGRMLKMFRRKAQPPAAQAPAAPAAVTQAQPNQGQVPAQSAPDTRA